MAVKKRWGADLLQRTSEIFDIPGEAAAGMPRVTITGMSRVHVENHRGLLEYSPEAIVVNTGGFRISVKGTRLDISAMSDMELVITGSIKTVEYTD